MKKFQRKIEDFICENCGQCVTGDGYTNHCPKCLWSKHVDINPGDRKKECEGMMKPMGTIFKKGENSIIHKCSKCAFERKNKVSDIDDFDTILKISSCDQINID